MKQLTYQDILDMNPCVQHLPSKYIPETWTGTIIEVLNLPNVAPREKLWVACRVLDDKVLRLFAVDCARRALSRIDNPDARSLAAVNVAEAFAHGNATTEELKAASAAAYAAYAAAYAAASAASASAAAYAAYAAEYAAYTASAASAASAAYAAEYAAAYAAAVAAYASASADTAYAAYSSAASPLKEREAHIEQLIKLIPEYADTSTTFPKEI